MKKLLPDPDLERLVQELNRGDSGDPEPPPAGASQGDAPPPALDPVALGEVGEGEALDRLLARMVRAGTVAEEEARIRSTRPEELESLLR